MISAVHLLCVLHPMLCHSPDALSYARDVDAVVEDEGLRSWLVIMAHHESEFSPSPSPKSPDAKNGTSCGYLQMRCSFVRTHSTQEQIREWLRNVEASSIACVMGSCEAAHMATVRAREAVELLKLARQSL